MPLSNSTQSNNYGHKASKELVKIIIPSFKRPNGVKTLGAISHAAICCPAREVEAYQKNYPDTEIIGHPDEVYGINQARQWIYEKYPNVMMLDDDIHFVLRMTEPPVYEKLKFDGTSNNDKLTPDEAYEVVQNLARVAKEMGAYLFGFCSSPNPRDVKDFMPFLINAYVKGTTMGMLEGSKLHFPMEEAGRISEDHYVTLLNAYHHRFNIIDNRYSFIHKGTFKTVGGCSDYRTSDSEEVAYKFLRQKFGEAVQLKKVGTNNKGQEMARTHAWERVIHIPY